MYDGLTLKIRKEIKRHGHGHDDDDDDDDCVSIRFAAGHGRCARATVADKLAAARKLFAATDELAPSPCDALRRPNAPRADASKRACAVRRTRRSSARSLVSRGWSTTGSCKNCVSKWARAELWQECAKLRLGEWRASSDILLLV
ncbi:hypothetical protein RI054_17g79590 [Pseudoscourfieldia marina]